MKLSNAVAVAMLGILLMTQPACVTQALLTLGEPSGGPTEQPLRYTRATREGRVLALTYESTVDADGVTHANGPSSVRVDLATAPWRPLGSVPMDPYCAGAMWGRLLPNAPPQPPAALIPVRPSSREKVALIHKEQATGFPPMSVQLFGLDAWILCGSGDAIGVTEVPAPPPPESGERSTGAVVAIVILFPFALAADVVIGLFYVAAAFAR